MVHLERRRVHVQNALLLTIQSLQQQTWQHVLKVSYPIQHVGVQSRVLLRTAGNLTTSPTCMHLNQASLTLQKSLAICSQKPISQLVDLKE